MPTARCLLTVISAQSALPACGGCTYTSGGVQNRNVPVAHYRPPACSLHVDVICYHQQHCLYLLGGGNTDKLIKTVPYASVASLIQRATSHPQQSASAARPDSTSAALKTLQDIPLKASAAASLGGMLLAVGSNDDQRCTLPVVHIYSPATSIWIRVQSGDLPEPRYFCTAVELAGNRLLVVGGWDQDNKRKNTVFLGLLISV